MKTIKAFLVVILTGIVSAACFAQSDETELYTYATYFQCSGGPISVADAAIADDAERMDGFVEDGTITAWGWMAHNTGGKWQRIFYHQAESLDALLDASNAIQGNGGGDDEEEEGAADEDDGPTFGSVCNEHDDYIWQVEAGTIGQERGAAGFSVYYVCDLNGEDRADEIVNDHFAPVLNKLVEDGELTSWGWQSHFVGGEFRKLQTMTGTDHKALLAARAQAIDAIYGEDDALGAEFAEICGSHVDYMWDIIHETP